MFSSGFTLHSALLCASTFILQSDCSCPLEKDGTLTPAMLLPPMFICLRVHWLLIKLHLILWGGSLGFPLCECNLSGSLITGTRLLMANCRVPYLCFWGSISLSSPKVAFCLTYLVGKCSRLSLEKGQPCSVYWPLSFFLFLDSLSGRRWDFSKTPREFFQYFWRRIKLLEGCINVQLKLLKMLCLLKVFFLHNSHVKIFV